MTPFAGGRVDQEAFAALVERQVAERSHGVLIGGTTAEATSLSLAERAELFKRAVEVAGGRLPVVAGTGSASYEETVELTALAEKAGVDAVLIVTPYYVRPPQAGLVEYFAAVGARTALPVLIYHIPGRAAVSVTAATVGRIAERLSNLVGIKHAVAELDLVSELIARLGAEFRIFCGLESLSLPMLAVGAAGVMNAVGNLAPRKVAALCEAVEAGDLALARRLHHELFELNQAIFLDTNPIPLKYMMWRMGLLPSAELRLPLVPLDAERQRTLDEALRRARLVAEQPAEARR